MGVETPLNTAIPENAKDEISKKFGEIMTLMGLDLQDDSLSKTPERVSKMFLEEIFWGLRPENFPKIQLSENKFHYDQVVTERGIPVKSMCEHHFVPIKGIAVVSYLPKDHVIGLSKLNRIVEYFSRRPQIQERLTEQIFHALSYVLETEDVAVCIKAEHLCVSHRGIQHDGCDTVTTKLGGVYFDGTVRHEFLSNI